MNNISINDNIQKAISQSSTALSGEKAGGGSFGNFLKDAINQVNGLEANSQVEVNKFMNDDTDLHTVVMALEKADLSFQVMMQVRNKIVSAYQEIMKTQV